MKKGLTMKQEINVPKMNIRDEKFLRHEKVFQFVHLIVEKYNNELPFKAILEFTHESEIELFEDVYLLNEDGEKFYGILLHSSKLSFKEYFGAGLLEEEYVEYFLLDNGSILVVDTVIETCYNGDRIDKFYYRKLSEFQNINGLNINDALDCLFKIIKQSLFNLDIREDVSSLRAGVIHVHSSVEENDDVPF